MARTIMRHSFGIPGHHEPVDLSRMGDSEPGGITRASFRTNSGLWYVFSALRGNSVTQQSTDERVEVMLRRRTEILYSDGLEDVALAPFMAVKALKNWVVEGHKFPDATEVSLSAEVINPLDVLHINGRETSPVVSAAITEKF